MNINIDTNNIDTNDINDINDIKINKYYYVVIPCETSEIKFIGSLSSIDGV